MPETNVIIEFEVISEIVTPGRAVEAVTAATSAVDSFFSIGQVHWQVGEELIAYIVVVLVIEMVAVVAVVSLVGVVVVVEMVSLIGVVAVV